MRGRLSYMHLPRSTAFLSRMKLVALALFLVGVCGAQGRAPGGKQHSGGERSSSQEMVNAHNALRGRLKLPPLVWSDQLARYAQEWANRLAITGQLSHRSNPVYGENLFLVHGADAEPAAVVAAWASEARSYDYRNNSCQGRCGHYTQLIWRNTKRLGCGSASRNGTQIWVCNYDPPGNMVGERPY
jgi:pathogenesis-related protein 1